MKRNMNDARKQVAHNAYLRALSEGVRPPRAATFADQRKKQNKEACRKKRHWDEP
jgi:hypothetical protein